MTRFWETTTRNRTSWDKTDLFHADIALDATPYSTLIIENLHYYLAPGKSACDFIYVIPQPAMPEKKFSTFDEEARQEIVRVVNSQFDDYAKILSEHQLVVEDRHFIKEAESVEDGILSHVEKYTPDLLILGLYESSSPKRPRWNISSTSYAIVTHAACPVLVIKRAVSPQTKSLKVLFTTDGSSHSEKAALQLIRFLPEESTEILVFSAVSVNYYMLPIVEPYINYAPLEHAMQGETINMLEKTVKIFEDAGFNVTGSFFNIGDPVDQILEESKKNSIDLIAMGSHGVGGRLASWLLGSVSSKVLEYSEASVVILK